MAAKPPPFYRCTAHLCGRLDAFFFYWNWLELALLIANMKKELCWRPNKLRFDCVNVFNYESHSSKWSTHVSGMVDTLRWLNVTIHQKTVNSLIVNDIMYQNHGGVCTSERWINVNPNLKSRFGITTNYPERWRRKPARLTDRRGVAGVRGRDDGKEGKSPEGLMHAVLVVWGHR